MSSQDIQGAIQIFERLSFKQIFKELNVKANDLSQQVLSLPPDSLGIYEFLDGEEIDCIKFTFN